MRVKFILHIVLLYETSSLCNKWYNSVTIYSWITCTDYVSTGSIITCESIELLIDEFA